MHHEPVRRDRRADEPVSVLTLVNALLRYRSLILICALLTAASVIAWTLLRPRTYTSVALLMPQSNQMRPELAGLAAQFGVSVARLNDPTQSPSFYVDLLDTEHILQQAVSSSYNVPGRAAAPSTLVTIYDADGDTDGERLDDAVRRLRKDMTASAVQRTGMVRVSVRAESPTLARDIIHRFIALLHTFNTETRQSRAAEERKFTEARLVERRDELRRAEERLQAFVERNRSFAGSPQLQFQHDRLAREVGMQQALYTAQAESHEEAKIEEVRAVPVFTVIDPPREPARPDSRRLLIKLVAALALGLMIGGLLAFLRASLDASRQLGTAEYHEFDRLRRELSGGLLTRRRVVRHR